MCSSNAIFILNRSFLFCSVSELFLNAFQVIINKIRVPIDFPVNVLDEIPGKYEAAGFEKRSEGDNISSL